MSIKSILYDLPVSISGLINEYLNNVEDNSVSDGYGEFLVFNQTGKYIDQDVYNAVYPILNQFAAQNLKTPLQDRPKTIREKIYKIDPDLDICFIPRTLYELCLMCLAIKEELTHAFVNDYGKLPMCVRQKEETEDPSWGEPKCWHGFKCKDGEQVCETDRCILNIAYELNEILIKKIKPTGKGLTRSTIAELASKEIEFLQENYKEFGNGKCEPLKGSISSIFSLPNPEIDYGVDCYLIDDSAAALLLTVIDIECSEKAKHSMILYRGGPFERDTTCRRLITSDSSKQIPASVSFGTGVFAGTPYDADASAAKHWFTIKNNRYRDAYLLMLPIGHQCNEYFYIPKNNTLRQMFGYTDTFHARTKIPRVYFLTEEGWPESGQVKGLFYRSKHTKNYTKQHFPIDMGNEELEKAFHACKVKYGVVLRREAAIK